jgi:DNA-binding CsgD family transcriptional regulator
VDDLSTAVEVAMGSRFSQEKVDSVVRLSRARLDLKGLFEELVPLLRRTVTFDAACWHTLDPASLLETSHLTENLPIENPLATEIEYLQDDYNQFAALARARLHSGVLSQATGGEPRRSRRYRELIKPFGLEGELRTTFVNRGSAWGAMGLLRQGGDFDLDEAAFLQSISGPLAEGIRNALLLNTLKKAESALGPGLILLDDEQRVEVMTPTARTLLSELLDAPTHEATSLPYVVYAVAARATLENSGDAPAIARVQNNTGRWLELHGAILSDSPKRIAVIVQPASSSSLESVLGQAYGLTLRESHVTQLLLRGFSTKEIASALGISPYTVQEHFTAIFDKVGVRSRRELVARIFYQQYESRRLKDYQPQSNGWFDY